MTKFRLCKSTESESAIESYRMKIQVNITIFASSRFLASYSCKAKKPQDHDQKLACYQDDS
ncbi:hypothetical protein T4D_12657 [Trichinella pseudospiralis]|uniref:Uncharacterized protein n=1 Tax=Trichinella pseudospiralis TaxID=6337 RepID=A0A0V1FUX2_TRIPS|nr:hypothetical protein T4D_12657 [Trichinella pseudospiralis]